MSAKVLRLEFTIRGCPRCDGAIETRRDKHGAYRSCLMCGWHQDVDAAGEVSMSVDRRARSQRRYEPTYRGVRL